MGLVDGQRGRARCGVGGINVASEPESGRPFRRIGVAFQVQAQTAMRHRIRGAGCTQRDSQCRSLLTQPLGAGWQAVLVAGTVMGGHERVACSRGCSADKDWSALVLLRNAVKPCQDRDRVSLNKRGSHGTEVIDRRIKSSGADQAEGLSGLPVLDVVLRVAAPQTPSPHPPLQPACASV
jgi:hypothetical protein